MLDTADLDLAVFDEFAEAVTYTPAAGGGPLAVTVILDRGVERSGLGELGTRVGGSVARLRASEVAAPKRGDTLAVGADTFKVMGAARDLAGTIWTLDLNKQ